MWLHALVLAALLVSLRKADCQLAFGTTDLQNGTFTTIHTSSLLRTDYPTSNLVTLGKIPASPSSAPPFAENSQSGANIKTPPSSGSQSSEKVTAKPSSVPALGISSSRNQSSDFSSTVTWPSGLSTEELHQGKSLSGNSPSAANTGNVSSNATFSGSQPPISTTPGAFYNETNVSASAGLSPNLNVDVTGRSASSSLGAADRQNNTTEAPSFGSLVGSTRPPTGSNATSFSTPDVASDLGPLLTFLSMAGTLMGNSTNSTTTARILSSLLNSNTFLQNILQNLGNPNLLQILGNQNILQILGNKSFLQNLGNQNLLQNLGNQNLLQNLGLPSVLQNLDIQKILQQLGDLPAHLHMSPQCSADLSAFQTGLERMEMWALQMVDAMGKPQAGILLGEKTFVGQYDECRAISQETSSKHVIDGLFCTVQVKIDFSSFGPQAAILAAVASTIFVDVCLPTSCRDDILPLAVNVSDALGLQAEGASCVVSKDPVHDKLFWVTIGIISFLTLLGMWGTAYGVFLKRRVNTQKAKCSMGENYFDDHVNEAFSDDVNAKGGISLEEVKVAEEGHVPTVTSNGLKMPISYKNMKTDDRETEVLQSKGLCSKLLLSFSVLDNGSKLLSFEKGQGDLSCLHGLRVITITWVILGHAFIIPSTVTAHSVGNTAAIVTMIKDWTMTPVVSGTVSVDTFFLLSGCLTSYLFLRQSKKAGSVTCRTMVLYYVHRFWRLTPLYMVAMMFYAGIAPYLTNGPYDGFQQVADHNCRKYWWANLLYVNNLVDMSKMCMAWSWYLSDDMQFYVIAPLVLVPWAFRKTIVGIFFCLALIVVHIVTNCVFITRDKLQFFTGDTNLYMKEVYFPPWTRVAPFAVGLMLGYALLSAGPKYKMQPLAVVSGWLFAAGAGLTSVYVQLDNVHNMYKTGQIAWDEGEFAAYESLSRPAWACAVAWVVFACCTGYGGFVNTFLSWRGWGPLSRLTYGVYLFHLTTLYVIMSNKIAPFHLSSWTVAEMTISVTVLTYMVSFAFSLLVESPTLGLEKVLLGGAGKRHK